MSRCNDADRGTPCFLFATTCPTAQYCFASQPWRHLRRCATRRPLYPSKPFPPLPSALCPLPPAPGASVSDGTRMCRSKATDVPNPPGYVDPSTVSRKASKKASASASASAPDPSALKMAKAWELAYSPAKSLPMNAIMLYMSGSSVQIFSMMAVSMLITGPVRGISGMQNGTSPPPPRAVVRGTELLARQRSPDSHRQTTRSHYPRWCSSCASWPASRSVCTSAGAWACSRQKAATGSPGENRAWYVGMVPHLVLAHPLTACSLQSALQPLEYSPIR